MVRKVLRGHRKSSVSKIEKLGAWAGIAANLVTAFAGAGAFGLYLWSTHGDYVEKRDALFSYNWINFAEGCIDCPVDSNNEIIKLNIRASDGNIFGEIYIDDPFGEEKGKPIEKKTTTELIAELDKSYTNWFMVEGELTFRSGTIRLFDYRMGEKRYFGTAHIELTNNSLEFEAKNRAYATIPTKIVFSTAIEDDDITHSSTETTK